MSSTGGGHLDIPWNLESERGEGNTKRVTNLRDFSHMVYIGYMNISPIRINLSLLLDPALHDMTLSSRRSICRPAIWACPMTVTF